MANDYFYIKPHGRHFAVFEKWEPLLIEEEWDPQPDKLVAICVYKVGAEEVKRRLQGRVVTTRKMVICRKCRVDLRAKGQYHVPEDADLAADSPVEERGPQGDAA